MQGTDALHGLVMLVEELLDDGIDGDMYELGTWRAGTSITLIKTVESYGELRRAHASRVRSSMLTRGYWFFDSFNGFAGVPGAPARLVGESANYYAAPLERVRRSFARYGVHNNSHVHFVKGIFEETLPQHRPPKPIALLRLDGDLYQSTLLALRWLYRHVAPGGWVVIDDYDVNYGYGANGSLQKGCRDAVNEFRDQHSPRPITSQITRKYGKPAW